MGFHPPPLVRRWLLARLVAAASLVGGHVYTQSMPSPNILFIILDDVGKDQLTTFNPASPTGLLTPTLNAIAAGGDTASRRGQSSGCPRPCSSRRRAP